jgi:hypothetical protein
MRRVGLVASAVAFARSERGQQLIADARRKYDTPENRAKLSAALGNLRNRPGGTTRRTR